MSLYITKEQLEARVKGTSSIEIANKEENRGTVSGKKNSLESKILAGVLVELGEDTNKDIAELTGMSPSQVSNYSKGMHSRSSGIVDKDLKESIETTAAPIKADKAQKIERMKDRALDAISQVLEEVNTRITLEPMEVKDLSKVGVDIAKIHSSIGGGDGSKGGGNKVVIINAPARNTEAAYKVIEA